MCVCTEATIGKDSQLVKNAKTEILKTHSFEPPKKKVNKKYKIKILRMKWEEQSINPSLKAFSWRKRIHENNIDKDKSSILYDKISYMIKANGYDDNNNKEWWCCKRWWCFDSDWERSDNKVRRWHRISGAKVTNTMLHWFLFSQEFILFLYTSR